MFKHIYQTNPKFSKEVQLKKRKFSKNDRFVDMAGKRNIQYQMLLQKPYELIKKAIIQRGLVIDFVSLSHNKLD